MVWYNNTNKVAGRKNRVSGKCIRMEYPLTERKFANRKYGTENKSDEYNAGYFDLSNILTI